MAIDKVKVKIETGEIDNFFDCLSDVLLKHSGGKLHTFTNFKKCWSSFMLCRYLSMKSSLMDYSIMFNQLQTILTSEQLYILAYNTIPKQSSGFITYISKKDKKDKEKSINIVNNTDENKHTVYDL